MAEGEWERRELPCKNWGKKKLPSTDKRGGGGGGGAQGNGVGSKKAGCSRGGEGKKRTPQKEKKERGHGKTTMGEVVGRGEN